MICVRFLTLALCLSLAAQAGVQGQNSPPDIYEGAPHFDNSSATTQNVLPPTLSGFPEPPQIHTIHSDDDVDWGICPQFPHVAPRAWLLVITNPVIPEGSQLLVELYENGPQSPPTKTLSILPGPLDPTQEAGRLSWWQDPYLEQIYFSVRALGSSSPAMSYDICFTWGMGATLPVNPVEERTIFMAPATGGNGDRVTVAQTSVQITPGEESLYSLHCVEFPGFVPTEADDPNRIEVTMRSATIFERASPGAGQNFPTQSAALFVIETHNALGQPIAFNDRVNIAVQFVESSDPSETDVVTLDTMPGLSFQMRLARDVQVGTEIDFNLLGDSCESINTTQGLVTLQGFVGLTGSDGMGTWGAAVDLAVSVSPGFDDLIDHLIGTASISQPYQNQVDYNSDGILDAADVVSAVNASGESP